MSTGSSFGCDTTWALGSLGSLTYRTAAATAEMPIAPYCWSRFGRSRNGLLLLLACINSSPILLTFASSLVIECGRYWQEMAHECDDQVQPGRQFVAPLGGKLIVS